MEAVRNWLRVFRIQTAFTTVAVLLIGYITIRPINLFDGALLIAIGVLDHMWGISQNEYYDLEYDKKDPGKKDRPLVRGDLNPVRVYQASWLIIAIAHLITLYISVEAFILFLSSSILGWHYNTQNKTEPISELSFCGWGAVLVFVGASVAGSINMITVMLSAFIFVELFFLNSLGGGLKDLDADDQTIAKFMGLDLIKCVDRNPTIVYTPIYLGSVYVSKMVQLMMVGAILWILLPSLNDVLALVLGVASMSLLFGATLVRVFVDRFRRDQIKSRLVLHELTSLALLAVALMRLDVLTSLFILIFPAMWFVVFNVLLETSLLDPGT